MYMICDHCLLQKFKPILHFHNKQKICPISWENYILYSKKVGENRISYTGPVLNIRNENLQKIPYYGKVMNINEYITELIYIFVYPINPGYKIGCKKEIGYHTGDIEHIIIRINRITKQIIKVYFSSHSKEHQIKEAKDLHIENDTLCVFVSLNSHANYPKESTYFRIFGLANDRTNAKGLLWYPNQVILLDNIKQKQYKSIGIYKNKKYCVQSLNNKTFSFKKYYHINKCKRFFLPFF